MLSWTREPGPLMSINNHSSWTTSRSWMLMSSTRCLELCKAPSTSRSRKARVCSQPSTRTSPKILACQSSQIRASSQGPQTDKFRPPSINFNKDQERSSITILSLMMRPRLNHPPKTSRGPLGSPTERETRHPRTMLTLTIRTLN